MINLASAFAGVTVGKPQIFRNMAVFPLHRESGDPAYLTLDEALATGAFRVTEVSEAGDVNSLRALNTLDRPVLLVDGEEVVGAKQNRIFNLSILVPAASELVVPVSCVEAGRWRHESAEFKTAPRAQYAGGRGERLRQVSASMMRAEGARSDQHEVWANIERKHARLGVQSETRAMADMYQSRAGSVEEYVAAFALEAGQAGAAFALNGEMVGLDLFDSAHTFAQLAPKIFRSYALDAIEPAPPSDTEPHPAAFIEVLAASQASEFAAVGLGTDVRFAGAGVRGAGLVWNGTLVHLCAFRSGGAEPPRPTGMRSASQRARGLTSRE